MTMLTGNQRLAKGHKQGCDIPRTREAAREGLALAFPCLPPPEARTLTEEPFFLLLGIPPNRNFKPAIFFPFPFFFPSLEPLIFFRTPGPGETEDSYGTVRTAIPQSPHPSPGVYRKEGRAAENPGSRLVANTVHRARPSGQKAAHEEPEQESICPGIQERVCSPWSTGL